MFYTDYRSENAVERLAGALGLLIDGKTVFMCIGNPHTAFDSLGAVVGNRLSTLNTYVYGNTQSPIKASNLASAVQFIRTMHPDSKIVAIDAAIGTSGQLGTIALDDNALVAGSLTNKNLTVGDISVTATVCTNTLNDYYMSATDIHRRIDGIATVIADAIHKLYQA